jgi:hypothetical protein
MTPKIGLGKFNNVDAQIRTGTSVDLLPSIAYVYKPVRYEVPIIGRHVLMILTHRLGAVASCDIPRRSPIHVLTAVDVA